MIAEKCCIYKEDRIMVDYTEGSGKQYHTGLSRDMIGDYVLMPGDPKRCELIASFLEDAKLVADVREFVTYTGYVRGCSRRRSRRYPSRNTEIRIRP